MIYLAIPNLEGNEAAYLKECVTSNFVSSVGPFVSRFEKQIAEAAGAKFAVTTSSGTTALHLALLATGVRQGDLVIVPDFTFIATANAVSHCGATPWLFDVEPEGWTLDPELVRKELERGVEMKDGVPHHRESGRRIGALMPVAVLGNPVDLDPLITTAQRFNIPIVVDGAAALGATYKSGQLNHPRVLTALSFNGNKTITSGGGGAVVGDDETKIAFIRHISSTARVGAAYHHDQVGFNFRMTNIQAAVGCAQIERLASFLKSKRQTDLFYRKAFAGQNQIEAFPRPPWGESACWFSGLVIKPNSKLSIEHLIKALTAKGVESKPFWKALHLQPPYANAPHTALKNSSELWPRILTLPCSTSITGEELNTVAEAVLEVVNPQ